MKLESLIALLLLAATCHGQKVIPQTSAEIAARVLELPQGQYRIVVDVETNEQYLAIGTGTGVNYASLGGSGSVSSEQVATYAAARILTTTAGKHVTVQGRNAVGDGGQGVFVDVGTVAGLSGIADDDGYHLFSTGGTRVLRRLGNIKPEHYGGVGFDTRAEAVADSTDNTPFFDKMEAARSDWGATWEVDKIYRCVSTVQVENYGSSITMTGALLFPTGAQVTGFEVIDPVGKDQDGNTPIYTGIKVLKGPQGSHDWTGYSYGDTMSAEGDAAILQTWNETDIGIRTVSQTNLTMINPEVLGFAIGYCTDTTATGGTGSEAAWNRVEGLITYQTRVGHLVRARTDLSVTTENGWANEFDFTHKQTNGIATTDESSYGFVCMGDPTLAVANRHKIDGIRLRTSHEGKANEAGGQELVPVCIIDGQSMEIVARNDVPEMIFRVFDRPTANAVSTLFGANADITIETHKIWNSGQFEIATGTNVRVKAPGTTEPQVLLVDASDIRRRLVPDGKDYYRVQGPYLTFLDSTVATEPDNRMWKVLSDVNSDGTVNTQAAAINRGGIGARINLGTGENYGGSLVVNVETTGTNSLAANGTSKLLKNIEKGAQRGAETLPADRLRAFEPMNYGICGWQVAEPCPPPSFYQR